jgi:hypothetical protein
MQLEFSSLGLLGDADRSAVRVLLQDASSKSEQRPSLAALFRELTAALDVLPRPTVVWLDALADLADGEVEALRTRVRVLELRRAATGRVVAAAFFADLGAAFAAEQRRRDTVLTELDAAIEWYDAHLVGRG